MACTPPFVPRKGLTRSGQKTTFCRNPMTGETVGFDMRAGLNRVVGPPPPAKVDRSRGGGQPGVLTVIRAPQITTTPQALHQEEKQPMASQGQALAAVRVQGATANLSFGGLLGGIGRGLAGFIPGGGAITGALDAFRGRSGAGQGPGTSVATVGCPPGLINIGGRCVDITAALPGGRPFTSDPIISAPAGRMPPSPMGSSRVGGGFAPEMVASTRSDCGPKHLLGWDGLCYPKRGFPNKDRMWPKGRAPLLTGGERNAITTANRAAKKIERTTKQLQRMGMIKKPNPRRRIAAPAMRQITPGTSIVNVE